MREHWFWFLMMMLVVIWYSTVTLWVTIRGTQDIRGMLKRLKDR